MTTIAEIRAAYIKDRAEAAWTSKDYDTFERQAGKDFDAALAEHDKQIIEQVVAQRENPTMTPGGKIRCLWPLLHDGRGTKPCARPIHHGGMHDTVSWAGE